ncbi:major capsid proteiN [Caudoviricetes sp.]|nr:major capsid proteiN [Caudoviricetes sp.]
MSFQVDTALVQAYRANIDLKFQQMGSRLRGCVRNERQGAEFEFYDRIGPVDAVEVTSRHADTPLISTPHDRRRVGLRDFDWADLIDNKDKIRMLADPTSSYVTNAVMALGRAQDDVIIQAAFGTAYTGKTGSTNVSFPSASEIAVDYVESGSATNSNLTIGKLRRARYLLDKAEATTEGQYDLYLVVDPSQIQSLLRTTEVTNSDYNTIKALVAGEIDTYMGFKFIKSNRLTVVSNVRQCIAFERQGLLLATGMEITVDVGPRRDKRNSVQVYVCGSFGATRMWEEKVLRIKCDETV